MRNCLLVLVAGVMLSVPLGCDREVVEDPVAYDREVDGPPVAFKTPMPDYEIIDNPSAVRRRREALLAVVGDTAPGVDGNTSGEGQDPTGPSTPASDDEIAEIKAVVDGILKTKTSGDNAAAMAFFDEGTSTALQGMAQAGKSLEAKAIGLDLLMEEKFGAQYPAKVKEDLKKMPAEVAGSSSAAGMLGEISVDQLIFAKLGEKVVATGPQNAKFIFSKMATGWKLGFGKDQREINDLRGEVVQAAMKMLDAIKKGIDDGSITADNVDAKGEALRNQLVKPVADKVEAAKMKAAAGGAAPAGDGAAPAGDGAAPAGDGAAPAGGAATQPAGGGL